MKLIKICVLFLIFFVLVLCFWVYHETSEAKRELTGKASELSEEQKQLVGFVLESNYCEKDTDCKLIGTYHPVGCNIVVNIEKERAVRERIRNNISSYIYSGCPKLSSPPVCIEALCTTVSP
jgi:hypothetical protein